MQVQINPTFFQSFGGIDRLQKSSWKRCRSYNDTPLKKIILNGITTVSTDFKFMGKKAVKLILNKEQTHVGVPFYLTLRNSL